MTTDPTCVIEPSRIDLREGLRARAALTFQGPVSIVSVTAPEEFAASLSEATLSLRVAYGARSSSLELAYSCGTKAATHSITLEVKPLRWVPTSTWTGGVDGPVGREYGQMWIDEMSPDRLLVFGGYHYRPQQFTPAWDLWERDLVTEEWRQLTPQNEPPHVMGGQMAPFAGERANLLFGGLEHEGQDAYNVYELMRFNYDPGQLSWERAGRATLPVGEYKTAWIYDAPRARFISACGMNAIDGAHCKIKAYYPAEDRWETLQPAEGPAPSGRRDFFFAHDGATDRLLIFAGDRGQSEDWSCDCANDTWALVLNETPVRWVLLDDGGSRPIGRRNGAAVLDPVGRRWFVWGGTADGRTTFPGLFVMDLDAPGWVEIRPEGAPRIRSSGVGVYDAARNRLLMGFGNNPNELIDLWALEL